MHLDRLVTILEMISVAGRPVTVSEVHDATDLPKPTCYRLIQTLQDHRLIDAVDASGFVIGERLIRIALLGKSDVDVRRACAPLLTTATAQFNETVFLARFRRDIVEIIHVEIPEDPSQGYVHPGLGSRPMHACSCSKAIVAFAEPAFQETIINGELKRYTEFTKTSADELKQDFESIVKRGFAHCDQEVDPGIASVAAPVKVGNIGVTFSVGAIGPISRLTQKYRQELGMRLVELADQLTAAIHLSLSWKPNDNAEFILNFEI